MLFHMLRYLRSFVLVAVVAAPLFAYEYPLSETAIRNAYFLGAANNKETQEFLARYTHVLPMPKSGPHVTAITLDTPYAEIVQYSTTARNFLAVDAVAKFLNLPAMFRVRVRIDLTASYTPIISSDAHGAVLRTDDFWRDFKINFIQAKTTTAAQHVKGEPIYVGTTSDGGGSTLSGAIVSLDYPATHVAVDVATVEVLTPDGQDVRSDFDIGQLQ